jgi:hypothetical protein
MSKVQAVLIQPNATDAAGINWADDGDNDARRIPGHGAGLHTADIAWRSADDGYGAPHSKASVGRRTSSGQQNEFSSMSRANRDLPNPISDKQANIGKKGVTLREDRIDWQGGDVEGS